MKGKEVFFRLVFDNNNYSKQLSTNKIISDTLELWYGIADKNGYYYEYPIFDDINDYEVYINNKKYLLKDYLKENNYLNNYFAIISTTKNKILGIEQFPVNRCNSFYSIPLNINFYNLIKDLDLTAINLKTCLFNNSLINYETNSAYCKTGYELLMFMESNNKDIMDLLNKERIKFLTKISYEILEYKRWGEYNLCLPKLITINFSKELKKAMEIFLVNDHLNLNEKFKVNDKLEIDYDTTKWVMSKIHEEQRKYESYYYWYINYLNKIFLNLKSLSELDNKPNFLVYGYYDEEVGDAVFK